MASCSGSTAAIRSVDGDGDPDRLFGLDIPLGARMLSASTEFAEVSNAINRAEVFRYVAKPWDARELQSIFLLAFERYDQACDIRRRRDGENLPSGSAEELALRRLEQEAPGITAVRCDPDGSVYLEPGMDPADWPW